MHFFFTLKRQLPYNTKNTCNMLLGKSQNFTTSIDTAVQVSGNPVCSDKCHTYTDKLGSSNNSQFWVQSRGIPDNKVAVAEFWLLLSDKIVPQEVYILLFLHWAMIIMKLHAVPFLKTLCPLLSSLECYGTLGQACCSWQECSVSEVLKKWDKMTS